VYLVGFIVRVCHDARSHELKILLRHFSAVLVNVFLPDDGRIERPKHVVEK
jgi:hypothetical protein